MKSSSIIAIFLLSIFSPLVLSQDEPGAIWMASPHINTGRFGNTAKWLIIHGTAGGSSAENIGAWFQNPTSQVSAHYVVGQDGKVVQCVREANTAWANGRIEAGADPWWSAGPNPNYVTISIEHVKPKTDNSDAITPAQKAASFNLVKNIIARNPAIRKQWANASGGITGHYSISPSSRARCPGPYPWEELFAFLNSGGGADECFGTVTATDGLNIRSQPTSQSSIVGSFNHGQRVQFHGRVVGEPVYGNNGWFHVGNGYVSAHWINLELPKPDWCY